MALGEPAGTEIAKFYRWDDAHGTWGRNEVDIASVLAELPVQLTALDESIGVQAWAALLPAQEAVAAGKATEG